MKTLETKSERIATRVTPSQKNLIAKAAAMCGRSLTEFIIDSAQKEAKKTLEDGLILHLAVEHQVRLAESLLHPPEPNEALKAAAKYYDNANVISQ